MRERHEGHAAILEPAIMHGPEVGLIFSGRIARTGRRPLEWIDAHDMVEVPGVGHTFGQEGSGHALVAADFYNECVGRPPKRQSCPGQTGKLGVVHHDRGVLSGPLGDRVWDSRREATRRESEVHPGNDTSAVEWAWPVKPCSFVLWVKRASTVIAKGASLLPARATRARVAPAAATARNAAARGEAGVPAIPATEATDRRVPNSTSLPAANSQDGSRKRSIAPPARSGEPR